MPSKCAKCGEEDYSIFVTVKCRYRRLCSSCYVSRFRERGLCSENCGHCDSYLNDNNKKNIDINSNGH